MYEKVCLHTTASSGGYKAARRHESIDTELAQTAHSPENGSRQHVRWIAHVSV